MPHLSIIETPFHWRGYLHPRHWPTWVGMGFLQLISYMPPQVPWLLGSALGQLLYWLHAGRRRVALRNINACFPELSARAARRLARRNFRATGQATLDFGFAWWTPTARLQRLVRQRGREHFEAALATDHPVILLMGHFVEAEIAGMFMASGRPVIDIYKKPRNELLHELMIRRRYRFGSGSLLEYREGLKPVIRALRRGEVLCYLPDQDPGRRHSVFVPFFGIQTASFYALGRLSKLTDARVVPCFVRQLPWGRGFEVIFKPALQDFPSGDDIVDTTRMNQAIESAVRDMPDQYFWVHKRFKTRPDGEPRFYD